VCHDVIRVRMAHLDTRLVLSTMLHFSSLDFIYDGPVESLVGALFTCLQLDTLMTT
jgi:hypothetical protein